MAINRTHSYSYPTVSGVCTDWQFTCDNGDCMSIYWECDEWDDCGDNSDEDDHCGRDNKTLYLFSGGGLGMRI